MADINDTRAVGNPQRAYEWEVELLGSSSAGQIPVLAARAMNVNIPEIAVETFKINHKSSATNHAGRDASPQTMSMTLWDDEALTVYNYMKAWLNSIRNAENGGGVTRDQYAGELLIKTFAHDSTTVTSTRRLTLAFINSLGEVSLSYDDSAQYQFDVTITFDENLDA